MNRFYLALLMVFLLIVPAFAAEDADKKAAPAADLPYIGDMQKHVLGEEETLLDVARDYNLGFVELRSANPMVDAWSPEPGTELLIPTRHILPDAPHQGIVVNLGEMRLYYFPPNGGTPESHPLGVGREGMITPIGTTKVTRKQKGPIWFPTPRMREEKPELPVSVPPGPENPLGTHALYLGWPSILIHGTNKPWGIGRRSSSGCIRMYPEDILKIFAEVEPGTMVTTVEEPIKIAQIDGDVYVEAHPSRAQSVKVEIEGGYPTYEVPHDLLKKIIKAAGGDAKRINWEKLQTVLRARTGYPIKITG